VSKLPLNTSKATIWMQARRFWIQKVTKLAVDQWDAAAISS
jgi:hypothetical protein